MCLTALVNLYLDDQLKYVKLFALCCSFLRKKTIRSYDITVRRKLKQWGLEKVGDDLYLAAFKVKNLDRKDIY
jgi:hypothetical protein